jgi:hypothetical protein
MVLVYEDGGATLLCDVEPTKQYPSANKRHTRTKDVISNPKNPVNPDSEPRRQHLY